MPLHTNKTLKPGAETLSTPGFWRRLAAQLYDAVLLAAILMIANAFLFLFTDSETLKAHSMLHRIYLSSVSFLFYGWFWTHGGQTLGLRAWKIKVLTFHQKPISWTEALIRFISAIVSLGCVGLGFLWIFMNKNKHTWHDRVSKTALFFETPPK